MDRAFIDRCTDTTTFRILLTLSGLIVLPVLALGLVFSLVMFAGTIDAGKTDLDAPLILSSAGGAVGMLGLIRARFAARNPGSHNLTATLVCLAVGVATALVVGAGVTIAIAEATLTPWRAPAVVLIPTAVFVAANVAWVLSGIGWMQRLMRRYAEDTGAAYDGIPAVLLCVVVGLVVVAALIATSL